MFSKYNDFARRRHHERRHHWRRELALEVWPWCLCFASDAIHRLAECNPVHHWLFSFLLRYERMCRQGVRAMSVTVGCFLCCMVTVSKDRFMPWESISLPFDICGHGGKGVGGVLSLYCHGGDSPSPAMMSSRKIRRRTSLN